MLLQIEISQFIVGRFNLIKTILYFCSSQQHNHVQTFNSPYTFLV